MSRCGRTSHSNGAEASVRLSCIHGYVQGALCPVTIRPYAKAVTSRGDSAVTYGVPQHLQSLATVWFRPQVSYLEWQVYGCLYDAAPESECDQENDSDGTRKQLGKADELRDPADRIECQIFSPR